jgi:hypothetical protein
MAAPSDVDRIEEILRELPPELRAEVEDFVRFLNERRSTPQTGTIKFSWAGALRDLREDYTSTELAETSMDWWGG